MQRECNDLKFPKVGTLERQSSASKPYFRKRSGYAQPPEIPPMYGPFLTVSQLSDRTVLARRYGVIEARHGLMQAVHFRPFPKFASHAEAWLDRTTRNWRRAEDVCWLYFNEPRSCPGFLTLAYVFSSSKTSLATALAALAALDEIARIKRCDAIVCDASNLRLSERMMKRYGFVRHAQSLAGRNFIKRFEHPSRFETLRGSLFDVSGEERVAVGEVLHA